MTGHGAPDHSRPGTHRGRIRAGCLHPRVPGQEPPPTARAGPPGADRRGQGAASRTAALRGPPDRAFWQELPPHGRDAPPHKSSHRHYYCMPQWHPGPAPGDAAPPHAASVPGAGAPGRDGQSSCAPRACRQPGPPAGYVLPSRAASPAAPAGGAAPYLPDLPQPHLPAACLWHPNSLWSPHPHITHLLLKARPSPPVSTLPCPRRAAPRAP